MRIDEKDIQKEVTQSEIDRVASNINRLLVPYGLKIVFGHHFCERINDSRNTAPISAADIQNSLVRMLKQRIKVIMDLKPEQEGVLRTKTKMNGLDPIFMVFVSKRDASGKKILKLQTIFRKPSWGNDYTNGGKDFNIYYEKQIIDECYSLLERLEDK